MKMIDDDDDKALVFIWVLPSLCLMFIYMYMFVFLISSQMYFPSSLTRFPNSETAKLFIFSSLPNPLQVILVRQLRNWCHLFLYLPGGDDHGDGERDDECADHGDYNDHDSDDDDNDEIQKWISLICSSLSNYHQNTICCVGLR